MHSQPCNLKKSPKRVDLGKHTLLILMGSVVLLVTTILVLEQLQIITFGRPGSPLYQGSALIGAALLCVPVFFSIAKRSGFAKKPPRWFVSHVLFSSLGIIFILLHAAGGSFISVPGFIFFLLLLVVVQGFLSRALLASPLSNLFAGKVISFKQANQDLKENISKIIEDKIKLLERLDAKANEALFSVNLTHWIRHPFLAFSYVRLAKREADLVGSRKLAGPQLSLWRRFHILLGYLFVFGMSAHIIIATFFAGYVAGGGEIYWWHVKAWGAGWSLLQ